MASPSLGHYASLTFIVIGKPWKLSYQPILIQYLEGRYFDFLYSGEGTELTSSLVVVISQSGISSFKDFFMRSQASGDRE
jgi:hypothetical protein